MKRMLLIIDPQVDFISGALPVPGAVAAMDSLAEYVRDNAGLYSHIVVSADRHPFGHCSFKENGGEWPLHCVADSVGAAIWPPLMESFRDCPEKVTVLHKGERPDREEYSIFSSPEAAEKIMHAVEAEGIGQIDICGLAGDVCVASTITDGVNLPGIPQFHLLTRFTPSLDDGSTLQLLTHKYNIPCDR